MTHVYSMFDATQCLTRILQHVSKSDDAVRPFSMVQAAHQVAAPQQLLLGRCLLRLAQTLAAPYASLLTSMAALASSQHMAGCRGMACLPMPRRWTASVPWRAQCAMLQPCCLR